MYLHFKAFALKSFNSCRNVLSHVGIGHEVSYLIVCRTCYFAECVIFMSAIFFNPFTLLNSTVLIRHVLFVYSLSFIQGKGTRELVNPFESLHIHLVDQEAN